MSHDVFVSEFQGIGIIVPQSLLHKRKKEMLLLNTIGTWKELVIAFKETLAAVYIIVKDLAFFLI